MNPTKRFLNILKIPPIRLAIVMQMFYFFLSVILFLVLLREKNDFYIFYNAGKLFITDIDNLYNQENYLWDFRYFPLSALFFLPFSLIEFTISYILFNIINLILNFLIGFVLFKLLNLLKHSNYDRNDIKIYRYVSLYLIGFPHVLNYIYGQINAFITFFLLTSLYIFLKFQDIRWDFLGSIILGLSIIIKPTAFLLVPFLIILNFDIRLKKVSFNFSKSIIRIVGALIPVCANLIIFILNPSLWVGFLETNFTGNNPIALNFSFSLTKLITNFCFFYSIPFNQIILFLFILIIIGGLSLLIYIIRINLEFSLIYGYLFGILVMLLVYFDSWDHHLLALTPLIVILMITLPRNSRIKLKYIKPSLYFLNFISLGFVGYWYVIYPLFPLNFETTIVLIVLFYGISKSCLNKESNLKI